MRKISLDGGRTFIDPMADETFHELYLAICKSRNWNVIIDAMDGSTLLKIKFPSGSVISPDARARVLFAYLNEAPVDLVVKLPKIKQGPKEDTKEREQRIWESLKDKHRVTEDYTESANYIRDQKRLKGN